MKSLKEDVAKMQTLASEAFSATGSLALLAGSGQAPPEKLQKTLEQTADKFEYATLQLRRLCERHSPGVGGYGSRPVASPIEASGYVEQIGYGWLHICLNTLLPHCRFQSPSWLSDTIRRLLDDYESAGQHLPVFRKALLVIDEHSNIEGRHIFDQDNKGWKAVSNAVKGRLIPDDDQYTLAVALLSERSKLDVCHITILDQADAADFFSLRSSDYAPANFYGRGWN